MGRRKQNLGNQKVEVGVVRMRRKKEEAQKMERREKEWRLQKKKREVKKQIEKVTEDEEQNERNRGG